MGLTTEYTEYTEYTEKIFTKRKRGKEEKRRFNVSGRAAEIAEKFLSRRLGQDYLFDCYGCKGRGGSCSP